MFLFNKRELDCDLVFYTANLPIFVMNILRAAIFLSKFIYLMISLPPIKVCIKNYTVLMPIRRLLL